MANSIEKDIEYTISTLAIEKLAPSEEAIQLCRETAEGRISMDEAIEAIKSKYGISGGTKGDLK